MTAGAAAKIPRNRLIAGDGLRAAAAVSVLVFHTASTLGRARYDNDLARGVGSLPAHVLTSLNAGIFIFFALSGYLLSRGFARSLVLGERSPSVRHYAWSRVLRIVPAFWLAATATFVIEGTAHSGFGAIAAIYAFAQLYVVRPAFALIVQAWTLDVEMAFYIALPVCALLSARATRRLRDPRRRAALLLAGLALATVASAAWLVHANPFAWQTLPPMYFCSFAPGIALAIVEPLVADRIHARLGRFVPVLVATSLALFAAVCVQPTSAIAWRAVTGTAAAGALLTAALLRQWASGSGWGIVDNRVMRWLGERSYGIYLFHVLVLTQLHQMVFRYPSAWASLAAYTAATLAISAAAAAISWRYVEVPGMRLRERLAARRRPAQPALAEAAA